jgi:hypothetical protein
MIGALNDAIEVGKETVVKEQQEQQDIELAHIEAQDEFKQAYIRKLYVALPSLAASTHSPYKQI